MTTEPKLVYREAQPYVGIRTEATMQNFASVIDNTFPALFGAVKEQGIITSGPAFIRYIVINMDSWMQVEMGVPVVQEISVSGPIQSGTLPAGMYASVVHTGHYQELVAVTGALLAWAEKNGITWKTFQEGEDTVWTARVEFYLNDPSDEPDSSKWETELAFLTTAEHE